MNTISSTTEIWKPVVGYEGTYEVSNQGRVKSLARYKKGKVGPCWHEEKMMKTPLHHSGYVHCALRRNGKSTSFTIHRLVALAHIPNPDNKPQVNHKDSNRANNHVSNLEWCTMSENMLHGYMHGNKKAYPRYGEKNPACKLTEKQVKEIRELYKNGKLLSQIGAIYNMCEGSVYNITSRKSWKHI